MASTFSFDDPDFDVALSQVMRDEGLTTDLIDEAMASDHLWTAISAIAERYPEVRKGYDEQQAIVLLVTIAFTQGYRTGRLQHNIHR